MATLGTEATTTRRVLESLFCRFEDGNLWSPKHGVAFPVLKDMQAVMENLGHSSHFLLSILVKHLDHKNVQKHLEMQLDIVELTTTLAEQADVEASVSLLGTKALLPKDWVGDAGPILDSMAVMLENISSITVIARTASATAFQTAQIVASLPNVSYKK